MAQFSPRLASWNPAHVHPSYELVCLLFVDVDSTAFLVGDDVNLFVDGLRVMARGVHSACRTTCTDVYLSCA